MTVLALETATAVCGVAAVRDGAVIGEKSLEQPHVHSEKLLMLIEDVVRASADYDVVAVSIGPGSFTGLRIGLSVAKGLAYAGNKTVVAVPTLEALAWRAVWEKRASEGDDIVAMIDARRNDVYAAGFRVLAGEVVPNFGAEATSTDAVVRKISSERRTILMGDGVAKFLSRHGSDRTSESWIVPSLEGRLCSAASVALLGFRKARRGEVTDYASLEPSYCREFWTLVATQHSME